MLKNCKICGRPNSDAHHVKSRGSGGSDDDYNIVYLCRTHHVEIHTIGIASFCKKYDSFASDLRSKGWIVGDKVQRLC